MPDDHAQQVERFRAAQRATRLHLLTALSPLAASLDRFIVVEAEAGATLRRCTGCRLTASLDRGDARPLTPETLAAFLEAIQAAGAAWETDAVPEDALDGLTFIAERATADTYTITHILAPRANSPHARLLHAWTDAFPEVRAAVG